MKYAVDASKMKQIDEFTIEKIGIPAMVLMERAAYETVSVIKRNIKRTDRILVVCGTGNNGGDGVAAGRILYGEGYDVAILFIGEETKCSPQMKEQLAIARNLELPFENCNKLHAYNIIIDAIFGVGLTRPISGYYADIIEQINASQSKVFSVDIPSGISADSGKLMSIAVKADYTITFGYQKHGLLLYPGVEYAGKIIVADIGFPKIAAEQANLDTFYYEKEDLNRLPLRKSYSNKGSYGRVLVIAGSKGVSGAAYLSAKSAYRCGAGLVKVMTSEENRAIIQTLLPEALFSAYDEVTEDSEGRLRRLLSELDWASVIVVGPGLGQTKEAEYLLDIVMNKAKVPVIYDADAITLLAGWMDYQKLAGQSRIDYLTERLQEQSVLTPHLKELSRLIRVPVSDISDNLIDTAIQCSYNSKLTYVMKDARTIVSHQHQRYINVSGNHGMATGGSGDVLTGIIAALIAQGMTLFEASCLGVYVHGYAGDVAAQEKGHYFMMAEDLINALEKVLQLKGQ